jgi:hypothetical protein
MESRVVTAADGVPLHAGTCASGPDGMRAWAEDVWQALNAGHDIRPSWPLQQVAARVPAPTPGATSSLSERS